MTRRRQPVSAVDHAAMTPSRAVRHRCSRRAKFAYQSPRRRPAGAKERRLLAARRRAVNKPDCDPICCGIFRRARGPVGGERGASNCRSQSCRQRRD